MVSMLHVAAVVSFALQNIIGKATLIWGATGAGLMLIPTDIVKHAV